MEAFCCQREPSGISIDELLHIRCWVIDYALTVGASLITHMLYCFKLLRKDYDVSRLIRLREVRILQPEVVMNADIFTTAEEPDPSTSASISGFP